jgi:hypothetical protein
MTVGGAAADVRQVVGVSAWRSPWPPLRPGSGPSRHSGSLRNEPRPAAFGRVGLPAITDRLSSVLPCVVPGYLAGLRVTAARCGAASNLAHARSTPAGSEVCVRSAGMAVYDVELRGGRVVDPESTPRLSSRRGPELGIRRCSTPQAGSSVRPEKAKFGLLRAHKRCDSVAPYLPFRPPSPVGRSRQRTSTPETTGSKAGDRKARATSTVCARDPLGDPVEDDVESEHEVFVRVLALLVEGPTFDHRGERRVATAVE